MKYDNDNVNENNLIIIMILFINIKSMIEAMNINAIFWKYSEIYEERKKYIQ